MKKRQPDEIWKMDYILVQEVLTGNIQTWVQLYQKSYGRVLKFTRQLTYGVYLEAESHDDITLEAFSLCFRNLSAFEGKSQFSTWVCGYVKNLVRTKKRKANRRLKIRLRYIRKETDITDAYYTQDPVDILLLHERNRAIRRALKQLPHYEFNLIFLHVIRENSFHKLEKLLALPKSDIEEQYNIALEKFRLNFHRIYHRGAF